MGSPGTLPGTANPFRDDTMDQDPYELIARLSDVLGLLEDSRSGVSVREIALYLGLFPDEAERLLLDLRGVFEDIQCESRGGIDYYRIPDRGSAGTMELAPEVGRIRYGMFPRLDGRDLDGPHAN